CVAAIDGTSCPLAVRRSVLPVAHSSEGSQGLPTIFSMIPHLLKGGGSPTAGVVGVCRLRTARSGRRHPCRCQGPTGSACPSLLSLTANLCVPLSVSPFGRCNGP